ncbi:efflux RND transporter periplasmic adaptor subunit [Desulforhopalus sp. 52FAK]
MKNRAKLNSRSLKRMSSYFPILIPVVLFGAIWGLAGTIKEEKAQMAVEKLAATAAERPPANVVVMDLTHVTMEDLINLPGTIEPWQKLSVLSKVEGTVIEVKVSEGDKVTKGQPIALLDPSDYKIALNSARADYDLAAAHQKRTARLNAEKVISVAEMEEVEARLKTSKARLDKAILLLSRCEIKAPISGIVQRLDAREGAFLNAFDPIAEILQINRVKAVIGIPESDVSLIRDIQVVQLKIQALDDKEVTGRLHFLASSPETSARLYRLELTIDNGDNLILPGMFFRAHIVKRVIHDTISVPLFSVIKRNNKQFVYLEENGVARQAPVELGIMEDWQVQVRKGLSPGCRVVVEGHRSIDQGHKLNVVKILQDPMEVLL